MNTRLSDFAEQTRARGASVAAPAGPLSPGAMLEQPAVDEAALMNLLRLLNQVRASRALTPVERAFVLGARAVFEELARVCHAALAVPGAMEPPPVSSTEQPPVSGEPAPAGRPRARRRPTPGGATTASP